MSGRRVVAVPKPVPFRNKTPAEIRARREKDVQKRKKETAGTDTSELTGRARASFTELMRQRGEWAELEKIDNADEKAFIMRNKKKTANMDEILALLDKPPAERTSKDLSAISDQLRVSNVYARLVVSPEIEVHVARIVGYRRFTSKGGVVVRENQEAENFYAVLEGSLLIQHQDMDVMPDPDEALILEVGWMQKKSYIILANVVEGLGLAAADQTGTSDPFVKVKCGTTEVCTRTVAHTINPVWDQILRIEADDDVVELIVFDHDAWGDDDYLGSVEVLLSDLAKNMNKYHQFTMKLQTDPRYDEQVDELGVEPIQVSGTLTFNLQLTSVDYQEKLVKAIQEEKDVGGLPRNIMVAGDTLGEEQVLTGSKFPSTVLVEQPCILLRIKVVDYEREILPLEENERDRKLDFFSEIAAFGHWSRPALNHIAQFFKIFRYKADQVITQENTTGNDLIFIISGEVNCLKTVAPKTRVSSPGFSARSPGERTDENEMSPMHSPGDTASSPSRHPLHSPEAAPLAAGGRWKDRSPERKEKPPEVSFVGRLAHGDTLNLEEVLGREANAYTAISSTHVDVLRTTGTLQVGLHIKEFLEMQSADRGVIKGKTVIDEHTCAALVRRAPVFPAGDDLHRQHSELKDWRKYKEHLVSNEVWKHRMVQTMHDPRKQAGVRGLVHRFNRDPVMPDAVRSNEMQSTKELASMEKAGTTFDEDEGVSLTFKDKLSVAASGVSAQVYTKEKKYRPPTAKGSFGL